MNHLHDYQIVSENKEGVREICKTCRKILVTRKDKNERIDNKKYLQEHKRDFLQPKGQDSQLFKKHYGNASST